MTPEERVILIVKYSNGHAEVEKALAGISETELDTPEAPGEWSPRQVVHHLADSEMESAGRIRRLVALPNAVIQGYDQEEYARRLGLRSPDRGLAGGVWRGPTRDHRVARTDDRRGLGQAPGHILRSASSLPKGWLGYYAHHAHDHADQIRRARAVGQGS